MMRDKLSRREDRALLKALRAVVLTQFPNPDRKECPGTQTLHAIATKRISMFDPAHEHVGSCSPCFKELTGIRRALQRRKILLWAMATTGTAIVVFAVWLTYFRFQGLDNPPQPQTVQSVQPGEARPPVQSSGGSQATTPNPSVSPPEVKYEAALLDLRNASATRTVEPANPDPSDKPHEIPRGLLALTVQLPIGSDSGSYELQIRDSNQQAIQTTKGLASIEKGITRLSIQLDTRSIQPGEYEFAWRIGDLSWRQHKIVIR
jgi:hypothetical protein